MKCWRQTCNSRQHAFRPLEEESSLWALLVDPLGHGWRHLGFATHEDKDERVDFEQQQQQQQQEQQQQQRRRRYLGFATHEDGDERVDGDVDKKLLRREI